MNKKIFSTCIVIFILISLFLVTIIFIKNRKGSTVSHLINKLDTVNDKESSFKKSDKQLNLQQNLSNLVDENYTGPIVTSINMAEIVSSSPYIVERPELIVGSEILFILDKQMWDGKSDIKVTCEDVSSNIYNQALQAQKKSESRINSITKELESIFSDTSAIEHNNKELFEIYDEFIDYLRYKGVNERYIKEFTNVTLPKDKEHLRYYGYRSNKFAYSDFAIDGKSRHKLYNQMYVNIYDSGVYAYTQELIESGIFGFNNREDMTMQDWEILKNFALRMVTWHELTHVLQTSYVFVNNQDLDNTSSDFWQTVDDKLSESAKIYFWDWGFVGVFGAEDFNRIIGQESTAQGLSFKMLVDMYYLSEKQALALWNHSFGGAIMNKVYKDTEQFKMSFANNWPKTEPGLLGEKLYKSFKNCKDTDKKEFLTKYVAERLSNQRGIAQAVGYSHVLTPNQMAIFWDKLK